VLRDHSADKATGDLADIPAAQDRPVVSTTKPFLLASSREPARVAQAVQPELDPDPSSVSDDVDSLRSDVDAAREDLDSLTGSVEDLCSQLEVSDALSDTTLSCP
jgi:hypothetical protein